MTAERYAAQHDDEHSYVVEVLTGNIVKSYPVRQWKAANEYARVRNALDNPTARWPRLYPGHRTEVIR